MTSPELRHSRVAILGYFFVLGVATATWAARLPAIKESLGLSDGRLGLALFAVPAGSVLTLALSGRIADTFGGVRASGLVAGLGLAAGLLIGTPAAAIAGFALLGVGLAGVFPQIVSVAARLDPGQAGRNIGRIAAVAYSGLLGGPVAIGAIASGVGLRDALLVPAALALVITAAAGVLRPR